jgi:hypothetical protein
MLLTEQETPSGQSSQVGNAILWSLRKLKKGLWSVGGMVADAFLVSSGIGKGVQWIPWALLVVLDSYQLATGDYGTDTEFKESSPFGKTLTIGFEVMAMMTAAAIAKSVKTIFKPVMHLTNQIQISKWISKTPAAKNALTKMAKFLSGATSWIYKGAKYISQKLPKLSGWIINIIDSIGKVLKNMASYIWKLLSMPGKIAGKAGETLQKTGVGTKVLGTTGLEGSKNLAGGLKAATNVGGVVGGLEAGGHILNKNKSKTPELDFTGAIYEPGVAF